MNEAGSWWTVHPDCETACADEVFRPGLAHRCPPNGGGAASRPKKQSMPLRPSSISLFSSKPSQFMSKHTTNANPQRGDHLVVDHEEEVC
ncbi:hypothetical protein OSTOST_09284 [Ostertagia ostertagi]